MFSIQSPLTLIIFPWLGLSLVMTTLASNPIAKPGCPTKCGNVTIPYPFGIGRDGACSLSKGYNVNCNTSFTPPKPFLGTRSIVEIMDIFGNGQMRIKNFLATKCYQGGELVSQSTQSSLNMSWINLNGLPLVFSATANKFFVVGCDDYAVILGTRGRAFTTGCFSNCATPDQVINGSCSGIGCCQTSIPTGLKMFVTGVASPTNHTNVSDFNQCGHAFLAEQDKFTFKLADLSDLKFANRTKDRVPVMLDWFVGVNQTCVQAKRNLTSYACRKNSNCTDFVNGSGYRCTCLSGYHGNPYLSPGCTGQFLTLNYSLRL